LASGAPHPLMTRVPSVRSARTAEIKVRGRMVIARRSYIRSDDLDRYTTAILALAPRLVLPNRVVPIVDASLLEQGIPTTEPIPDYW
jgi:hypothetical protein